MTEQTIKRPVGLRQASLRGYLYDVVDADGEVISKKCSEETANEIAAALNATAEGTFAWAVRWMMDNPMKEMSVGEDDTRYRYNYTCGYFEYSDYGSNYWFIYTLMGADTKATDWRVAEVE